MIGDRITTRMVQARWAWGEMTSSRFAQKYPPLGADAVRLQGLAKAGADFNELPESDVDILVNLIHIRQEGFMPAFDGISEFECVPWSKGELLQSFTIQALSPSKRQSIPYSEFYNHPPHIVEGVEEWSDPRVAARSWPKGKPYGPMEPAIAINFGDTKMLIDGYGRSVIFMDNGIDADHFLVWVPASLIVLDPS